MGYSLLQIKLQGLVLSENLKVGVKTFFGQIHIIQIIRDFYICVSASSFCSWMGQSVVNNFCDEGIRIGILFAKDIFYK